MNETAQKIKELRGRRGYSQEELAEKSGLTSRTIQRIESGETEPRGDSMTRLAAALDVTVDDLVKRRVVKKNNLFIGFMNISAFSFLWFPLLGIIVPLILWLFRKGKNREQDNAAANSLLNFQITWNIVFFAGVIIFIAVLASKAFSGMMVGFTLRGSEMLLHDDGFLNIERLIGDFFGGMGEGLRAVTGPAIMCLAFVIIMYGYNLLMIFVNVISAFSGNRVSYVPAIRFLREREA